MALSTVSSLTESYASASSSLTQEEIPVKEKTSQETPAIETSAEPKGPDPVLQGVKAESKEEDRSEDEDGSDYGLLAVHD
jgi:hypothetical protein